MSSSRNTLQRDLVLAAVQQLRTHPTAEEIYRHVAAGHPSISRGTVYRNLNLLADRGDIRRVSHLNAADRFDFDLHPHYHFRCKQCDGVHDVELPQQHDLLAQVRNEAGFQFDGYEIVFSGLCPKCAKNMDCAN